MMSKTLSDLLIAMDCENDSKIEVENKSFFCDVCM